MNRMTTPWHELDLARYPDDPRDPLRAFDAADLYLLDRIAGRTGEPQVPPGGRVVVVGDRWGAVSAALAHREPTLVTDSWLAREALCANLARNGIDPAAVTVLTTADPPPARVDVLLVRVPKSLALLEDQLHRLAPALHEGSVVLGTGMVKEVHTSTLRLFERLVGPTRTSLARGKARLITAAPDPRVLAAAGPSPWPLRWQVPPDAGAAAGRTLVNHAGVFCADRLDIGTRFLLAHLPPVPAGDVVDLGCGNGVLGLAALLANPGTRVTFTDESFPALASAQETVRENGLTGRTVFLAGDGTAELPYGSADLVLNNPPFHTHQATSTAAARRMFTGARRILRPGGELWVVANRHLGHHITLRRILGTCEVVAGDPKFVVLRSVRR